MILRPLIFFIAALLVSTSSLANTTTVIALGDSLTEGYGIAKESAYPAILEKLLRDKKFNVTIVNAGISGSTSASALSRFQWQLKQKPQVLFLALGANDGLRGLPVSALQTNLEKVILLAQQNKIPVILAGMKIPMNYGEAYRKSYEKVFSDLAKKFKLNFMPFLLADVGGVTSLNQGDGIHPNEKGHEKMAQNILPYVEKTLRGL